MKTTKKARRIFPIITHPNRSRLLLEWAKSEWTTKFEPCIEKAVLDELNERTTALVSK